MCTTILSSTMHGLNLLYYLFIPKPLKNCPLKKNINNSIVLDLKLRLAWDLSDCGLNKSTVYKLTALKYILIQIIERRTAIRFKSLFSSKHYVSCYRTLQYQGLKAKIWRIFFWYILRILRWLAKLKRSRKKSKIIYTSSAVFRIEWTVVPVGNESFILLSITRANSP